MEKSLLRKLPSVDELLRDEALKEAATLHSAALVTEAARIALEAVRSDIISGKRLDLKAGEITSLVLRQVRTFFKPSLGRVVNASGTILHSNLGRAVLAEDALKAIQRAASGPVNLEFDTKTGKRGERESHVEELICNLSGSEAACVVNNNAAAVLITLNTLAESREVIISRGELIEIGGSFRLPEIIMKSGCRMKEVGTTNRTHLKDYSSAITGDTALLLKAHRSNFEVVGFTKEVDLKELVGLARGSGLPVVEDLGSGSLIDLSEYNIQREPIVRDSIKQGADLVTFSGDKLLGGPQAGIIAGRKTLIDRINKNPLKRALRVDKLTLSALEATLKLYHDPENLPRRLPTLRHLTRSVEEIEEDAIKARGLLAKVLGSGYTISIEDGESQVGSGSLPGFNLPTKVIAITHSTIKPEAIFKMFLENSPPVLGRVSRDRFMLDLRTVERAEDVVPAKRP